MTTLSADLHIHTALSPCADDEMTPPAIVRAAVGAGLQIIAVCDHNCAANAAAVQHAGEGRLEVIPGIEITTAEEVHVLGLFPSVEAAGAVGDMVLMSLPDPAEIRPLGRQVVMDAAGRPLRIEPHALFLASMYPLAIALKLIRDHGGIAVASHVDRPSFSILSQLGCFPEEVAFDAIELSPHAFRTGRVTEFENGRYPVVTSSDSHFLCDIGSCRTVFPMTTFCFEDFTELLRNRQQRISRVEKW